MSQTHFLWAVVLAAVATVGGRVGLSGVRGVDSGPQFDEYRQRVLALPAQLGDWVRLEEDRKLTDSVVNELKCGDAYVWRTYVNRELGGSIDVILLAGPPGPLTAHTPEICYSAAAYELSSSMSYPLAGDGDVPGDTLRRVQLRATRVSDDDLVVIYGWSDGEGWQAPAWPRLAFGHRQAILKVQLAIAVDRTAGNREYERALVRDLLAHIRRELAESLDHTESARARIRHPLHGGATVLRGKLGDFFGLFG
jgi:hypothetical protein